MKTSLLHAYKLTLAVEASETPLMLPTRGGGSNLGTLTCSTEHKHSSTNPTFGIGMGQA